LAARIPSEELTLSFIISPFFVAYQAWLGFYNSSLRDLRWTQDILVQNANEYALIALVSFYFSSSLFVLL